jgi:hypothetical protein
MSQHITRLFVVGLLFLLPSAACAGGASYDWVLEGEVVYTLEIPGSGGAWAVTIEAPWPEVGGTQYLLMICDHEQEVTRVCEELSIGDDILATGWIITQEPNTGQRLSVREIHFQQLDAVAAQSRFYDNSWKGTDDE